jgi:6-phosphogluconolactonase (cycloisomerase 2 family)
VALSQDKSAFVYVLQRDDLIITFRQPQSGAITQVSSFQSLEFIEELIVHPSGKFIYASGQVPTGSGMRVFPRDPVSGTFTSGAFFDTGTQNPRDIAITPDGRFLYLLSYELNTAHNSISRFAVNQDTGALTALAPPLVIAGLGQMEMSQDGRFLYATSGLTANTFAIQGFQIGDDGSLSPVANSPFSTGNGDSAASLVLDPKFRFLYWGDATQGRVFVSHLDSATGALSKFTGGFTQGGGVFDRSGVIMLGTTGLGDTLEVSSIDPITGAITFFPHSTVPTGHNAGMVAFDPSNSFVYVVNTYGESVSEYAMECVPAQGLVLAPLPGTPVPVPYMPRWITVSR